jgi:HPt (histidine-containing phosphotransfer) domain-containing protein
MSQTAMDAAAFTEMKELMGDSFKEIVSLCLQSLPEQLTEIETAIKDNNADTLFSVSHKMKSSCGSIGAFGLAERVEAIEIISREGSTDISEQLITDLRESTNQVVSILSAELQ